jgi:cytosine/adenosine deaminase-related metal-dependent hydrolase
MLKAYRARCIFPGDGQPIVNGVVTIRGGRILQVGKTTSASHVDDLGDVAILPGLINVHCHLEFSHLRRPLGTPSGPFADWIRAVIAWRQATVATEQGYWNQAIQSGLRECLAAGVTCVGDIVTVDQALDCYHDYPGYAWLFRELLGLTADRAAELSTRAERHISGFPRTARLMPALSPHAPYTTPLAVVNHAADLSRRRRFPVAMHLAESEAEMELLRCRHGPLVELLQEMDAWDERAIPGGVSCADFIHALSRAHRSLVVHGNYLNSSDWQGIAASRNRMVVVYCPRTHRYFGHSYYRLSEMMAAGVRVAIATDGRSSNPDLRLLDDLRAAARWHHRVDPLSILRAGTLTAAEAIGCEDDRGSLHPGKSADMITVPVDRTVRNDPWSALFASDTPVQRVFVQGRQFAGNRSD